MSAFFRTLFFVFGASVLLLSPPGLAQQLASTNAPGSTLTSPVDAAKKLIVDAIKRVNANDMDGAMNDLNQALKLNPNSTGAYVLRASLYYQKKQWPQAESDFDSAARLAPTNVLVKFNLAEIKFIQKQYDAARSGYAAL